MGLLNESRPMIHTKFGSLVPALALVLMTFSDRAGAQQYTAADLADRAIHRRAVEAVIWGVPARAPQSPEWR